MSIHISTVRNTVVCECINDELLIWVMWCVGHDIVLICGVLMCTTEEASARWHKKVL